MKKALMAMSAALMTAPLFAEGELITTPVEFTQGKTDLTTIALVVLGFSVLIFIIAKVKRVIR